MNLPSKLLLGTGSILGLAALYKAIRPWKRDPIRFPVLFLGDSISVGVGQVFASRGLAFRSLAVIGQAPSQLRASVQEALAGAQEKEVVVSSGVNSVRGKPVSEIVEDVSEVLSAIRASGKRAILLAPPPALGSFEREEHQQTLTGLTISLELGFRDVVSLWDLLSDPNQPGYYKAGLGAPDQLHPTRRGYEVIAEALLKGER